MDPGNISGWASGDIRESLDLAVEKVGGTNSEYVVESVRQRLEREFMLPHQRAVENPNERALAKARAAIEAVGPAAVEAAVDELIAGAAVDAALGPDARS